ncbi:MAG: hypothetical protein R6U52_03180 [Kosmotogaceae bacterium]
MKEKKIRRCIPENEETILTDEELNLLEVTFKERKNQDTAE